MTDRSNPHVEETLARRLGRWVYESRFQDLAPDVLRHAKRCMLDTLGVQIRGATLPWVQPVYRYFTAAGGRGEATVTYHGDRLSAPYAAYVNSTFSYSCELQHHGSYGSAHTGVIVIPAIQALAERLGTSGRDMISAMVAGYEVQGRLGAVLFGPANKRHFHPQGLLGVFSAAAAAGKLLGLDAERLAHAFAIAGSHASSILEYDQAGGEVKRIHGAIALRNGMQAAFLAKEGLTGPLSVFEGKRGIFASFGGGEVHAQLPFSEFGRPYCITRCRYRVYPTIGSCHAALDIVSDLRREHRFSHRDIDRIQVGMSEFSVQHVTTVTRPHDVISAQASLGFSLGLLCVKGSNDLELYIDPASWRDSEVLAIADKLQAYNLNDEANPHRTRVDVRLKSGRVLSGELEDARGGEGSPFGDEVMEAKFRRLAAALPTDHVEQLIRTVAQVETLESIAPLVPLLLAERGQ
ncbi:MAG: MmgE/PrpD family protein [Betaproteobacteria bacterium]|nr:MAG: MmgE/PrpD family protein [Betaproteobacteria bacterium]